MMAATTPVAAAAQQEGEEEFRSVDPAVAGKAFKKLRCVLADAAAVAPDRLANELYSDSIISRATLRLVLENSPASIVKMLDDVECWLERDGRHFSRLLTVFKNSSALTIDFAARLMVNYRKSACHLPESEQPPPSKRVKSSQVKSSQVRVTSSGKYRKKKMASFVEEENSACRALRVHYSLLAEGIQDPERLACDLYSSSVVSQEVLAAVSMMPQTPLQQKMKLLDGVRCAVAVDEATFPLFVAALKDRPELARLGEMLEALYSPPVQSAHQLLGVARQTLVFKSSTDSQAPLPAVACHLPESEQPPPSKRAKVEPLTEDMQTYASYLKSVYTKPGTINYDKWPHVKSRKFINLVLIGKESEDKQEAEKLKKATIHGNIDDILADSKAPINMAGVACNLEDGSLPKCILVEGAPGVGKSTFAWELCGKWGKGEMLQQYKLVVLLRLREKKVRKAKTVEDLFRYHNKRVRQAVVEEIEQTGGKGVLLLLEGYDELPVKERIEDSFFMSVIKGDELPEATILVTSRHSGSDTLYSCNEYSRQISQHVEIIGFTKDDINAYLEASSSGDSEFLSGIRKYLECYPHIHSMMYIPLNSAIVVEVYRNSKKERTLVPKTMKELYFSLICSLLLRYLKEHPEYSKQQWNIRSFLDLPPKVYKQFCEVARIAHEGYFNDQVIFSDLPDGFDSLGLMQCVPELYVDQGTVLSYNFLHMTVQEFLTAFHMSRFSIAEKINIFRKLMSNNRCNVVLRFLAGLTKFSQMHKSIKSIIFGTKSEVLNSEALHLIFETQEDIRRLLSIVSEDNCLNFSGKVGPFDAYVLGYCMLHSDCMWKQIDLSFSDIDTLNMLVHGANELGSNSTCKISNVHLHYRHDGFVQLPVLSQFLFEEMTLWNFQIDDHFLALFNSSSLTNLTLQKCDITEAGWKVLFQATTLKMLHLDSIKVKRIRYLQNNVSLVDLVIVNCAISDAQIQCLATILQDNTTLEGQGIWQSRDRGENAIGDKGAVVPSTKMRYHNSSLKTLWLSRSSIGPHGVACLAAGLTHNATVESLFLYSNHFGTPHPSSNPASTSLKLPQDESNCINEGVASLSEMLSLNKSLNTLNLSLCNLSPSDIQQLSNALCQNQTLTHLDLSGNAIGSDHSSVLGYEASKSDALCLELSHCISEGAAGLASMLSQNTSLKHLDLRECCISSNEAHYLANVLCHNQTLEELDLAENLIGTHLAESDDGSLKSGPDSHDESDCIGKGVIGFAKLLSVNTCMKSLDMSSCCINPSEAQQLAISLSQNEALEIFHLRNNDIGDEGATALASMLTVNKTLKVLDLSFNSITMSGTLKLIDSLTHNTTIEKLTLRVDEELLSSNETYMRGKHRIT